jgi:predicted transcriptional regulator
MDQHKHTTIHVRLDPDLLEQVERLAVAEERPLSSWVRRALREVAQRQAVGHHQERAA